MKKIKFILLLLVLVSLFTACSREEKAAEQNVNRQEEQKTDISKEESQGIEETQSLEEEILKKKLKEARNKREESITVEENDVTTGYMPKEVDDLQNGPIIEQSSEQYKQMYNTAATYIRDNLNINPKTKLSVYDAIDPTVLEIYTAEDRGYLQDYTVENIYVLEYQKEDGTWSYIFMGRENKQSPWKVVHSGDHFKE